MIDNDELAKIQHIDPNPGSRTASTIKGLYRVDAGPEALRERLAAMCDEVDEAIADGAEYIVLSDRDSTKELAPIPSLLMTAAVHHHLIRAQNRMKVGLLVEAGDVREVHHVALLIGYGASAVNPYLAMETSENLVRSGVLQGVTPEKAVANVIKALGKGVLKIMSKMGISTMASYAGAQAFEAIGLSDEFIAEYFTGTTSKLGGIGIDVIAAENLARHTAAYPEDAAATAHERLATGGEYQWRRDGAPHLFNPETVFRLQHSTRTRRYDIFREYTKLVDDQAEQLMTLRGMFKFNGGQRTPVPIDEVESVASIVKRFSTGAMSYGSISKEAHETLAIAMNRLGGKSNTGEGGEDLDRLLDPERRSAIKQVASGRFGVTSMYLTHATDLQIKLAQGAKPGEGGQLPSTKVYPWIARTRHGTAGVGLISPPPHHDIYSIEDLKQLIFDLKRANPSARVHTKLVSQSGIGAVAAGVAKALSDVILVSGHDGGTGASPVNSLKHAGTPVGARPRRDPADADAQRHARPRRRAGRRSAEDRPRRAHRCHARRRGVRLRDGSAHRRGLHHDARLPPRHLPRRRRHAEPRPARALQRQGRVRGELLRVHRPGGARVPRRARPAQPRRGDRTPRPARRRQRGRALEGIRASTSRRSSSDPTSPTPSPARTRAARSTSSTSTSTTSSSD